MVVWAADGSSVGVTKVKNVGQIAAAFADALGKSGSNAVMAEEASTRAVPSGEQMAQMQALVREALDAGAIGFASSFSPNHAGWAGRPMPSTIASDAELFALVTPLREKGRGIFVMATGPRATPEFMESIAADTGRPVFMATVLTMYNDADPAKSMDYYERCAAAGRRGREVFIHTTSQPLSFDFTLEEPYLLYSHAAFDRVKAAPAAERAAIYRDFSFRKSFRENLANPKQGILFYGDWGKVELEGASIAQLAKQAGKDPLDFFFDLPVDAQLVAKLFQNNDAGVAPLLRHERGVITFSDAGAHLIYFCDAGFGLHFLKKWVRETGTFTLEEGVRRLTSDPARKYRIPGRGRIEAGAWADLLLFDPETVGISALRKAPDLPGGGTRMLRDPVGVHGVWVNGTQVHDGRNYLSPERGPGQVLTAFSDRQG